MFNSARIKELELEVKSLKSQLNDHKENFDFIKFLKKILGYAVNITAYDSPFGKYINATSTKEPFSLSDCEHWQLTTTTKSLTRLNELCELLGVKMGEIDVVTKKEGLIKAEEKESDNA